MAPRSRYPKGKKSYRKRYGKKKVFKTTARQPAKPSKQLLSLIKREIGKDIEVKSTIVSVASASTIVGTGLEYDVATAITSDGYYYGDNLWNFPTLSAGTDIGNRIGNRIDVKSCVLTMVLTPLYNAGITSPFDIHILICRARNKIDIPPDQMNQFLRVANTQTNITGALLNSTYPFDKDYLRVYKHKKILCVYIPAVGTNDINNSLKFSHTWKCDLSRWCKNIHFGNDLTTEPTNSAAHMYLLAWIVPQNGVAVPPGSDVVRIDGSITLRFTDA